MKPSSPGRKPVSRAKAKNAAMLNLLATPGLGSLLCGRWIAGTGQLVLAVAGFILLMVWFFKEMIPYYGLMFGDESPQMPGLKMLAEGAILFVASWLWSAVTSVSLFREASATNLQSIKNFTAPPMPRLEENQIASAMTTVPEWNRQGDAIARTFQFKDFPAAVKFVDAMALLAEQAWHHPDIDIRWNKVKLVLTTHDAGGLTQRDFDLARQFDQLSLR
jgi:4a-hydroxytetrahydrobiopterin dehydratase